ncbi:MAG: DNA double-strand break repair nuclease NurA [Candidatus Thorarchaeota archaeon]
MLEKILTEKFRRILEATFTDIQNQQDRRDEEEFAKDELRIKEELLDTVDTYPSNIVLDEDFLVAAVDGSGNSNLVTLDDIRVHLLSSAAVVLNTGTKTGKLLEPLNRKIIESELGDQPHLDSHWHSGVRGDAKEKLAEALEHIYPLKDLADVILPFFRDHTNGSINTLNDIGKSLEYGKFVENLKSMKDLISREQMLTNPIVHDELRTVKEYAAARDVITSNLNPKYLLLDGAMSVFMHFVRKYPTMPSGFLLRELCSLARKKGIIVAAVSKNHTIPFAHRIANMAAEKFGSNAKWFCHLPSREDPGEGLHIYEDRTYIPPVLAVPYLFSFSRDNRPSRIDFDRIWWKENIFVPGNPTATRANEKELFRDLEFLSRDARWYGYPVALGLAHEACKMSYEDIRLAREIVRDVRHQLGHDPRRTDPLREDYNL